MYLVLREIRTSRARFGLVGLVVGLIAVLATLLSGLAAGLVDDGISGLRRLPLTHLAFQPGAEATFSRSILGDGNLEPWEASGLDVSPIGVSFFNARTADGDTVDLALFGIPADSFLVPDDQANDALTGRPGLVLSDELSEDGIEVGDELTIAGVDATLPVLGFTYTGTYGHVDIAFSSLEVWQQLHYGDNARGRFSAVAINSDDTSQFAALDTAAGTDTLTKQAAYAGSPGFSGETQTMTLIRVFLLVISALVVGAFFMIWTVQRTDLIGLLKALGATDRYVIASSVGQLGLILVAATAVGAVVATIGGQLIGGAVPFRLDPVTVLTTAVTIVAVGLAGALIAVRRITSVEPIVALKSRI